MTATPFDDFLISPLCFGDFVDKKRGNTWIYICMSPDEFALVGVNTVLQSKEPNYIAISTETCRSGRTALVMLMVFKAQCSASLLRQKYNLTSGFLLLKKPREPSIALTVRWMKGPYGCAPHLKPAATSFYEMRAINYMMKGREMEKNFLECPTYESKLI